MSDVSREEFEALKERVAELESGGVETTPDGLDHRDMAVLSVLENSGVRSGFQLVQVYQSATDITQKATAKHRAKALERHPKYKELCQ